MNPIGWQAIQGRPRSSQKQKGSRLQVRPPANAPPTCAPVIYGTVILCSGRGGDGLRIRSPRVPLARHGDMSGVLAKIIKSLPPQTGLNVSYAAIEEMRDLVPIVESIEEVYCDISIGESLDPECRSRWATFIGHCEATFGTKPDFVARSPGRVNIIGEHVDYSLYNVLPAALTVDALIAVKVLEEKQDALSITVGNLNSTKYPTRTFSLPPNKSFEIDAAKHEWTNYFMAGLNGALQFLKGKRAKFQPKRMEVVMDGNVPAGSGLSSSAALVCASILATLKANDYNVSKEDLLELAIVSERAVGVFSGGMDQAASVYSKRGFLLYWTFFPESAAEFVQVATPEPGITFLVAQSFVTADKHVTAARCYNLRVVECTLATAILAKLTDVAVDPDHSPLGLSLHNFQRQLMKKIGGIDHDIDFQLDEVIRIVHERLHQREGYTRAEISKLLGMSMDSLEKEYMSKFDVEAERFMLRQRALHVLQEARRVVDFKNILSDAAKSGQGLNNTRLQQLGDLMNEAQDSCRVLYDCSCPELDEICSIARKAGAYGSRLTGAGWGGSTVHLVPRTKVAAVSEALKNDYYLRHFPNISDDKLRDGIVVSKPGGGSCVIAGKALQY